MNEEALTKQIQKEVLELSATPQDLFRTIHEELLEMIEFTISTERFEEFAQFVIDEVDKWSTLLFSLPEELKILIKMSDYDLYNKLFPILPFDFDVHAQNSELIQELYDIYALEDAWNEHRELSEEHQNEFWLDELMNKDD